MHNFHSLYSHWKLIPFTLTLTFHVSALTIVTRTFTVHFTTKWFCLVKTPLYYFYFYDTLSFCFNLLCSKSVCQNNLPCFWQKLTSELKLFISFLVSFLLHDNLILLFQFKVIPWCFLLKTIYHFYNQIFLTYLCVADFMLSLPCSWGRVIFPVTFKEYILCIFVSSDWAVHDAKKGQQFLFLLAPHTSPHPKPPLRRLHSGPHGPVVSDCGLPLQTSSCVWWSVWIQRARRQLEWHDWRTH